MNAAPRTLRPAAAQIGQVAAFTLVEVLIACGILALTLAALYGLVGNSSIGFKGAVQVSSAQERLQLRQEQLRNTGWPNLCSPSYVASLLSQAIGSADPGITQESIAVHLMPVTASSPETTPYFSVTKTANGSASVATSSGYSEAATLAQLQLNFRLAVQWRDSRGTTHTKESSMVISRSGSK